MYYLIFKKDGKDVAWGTSTHKDVAISNAVSTYGVKMDKEVSIHEVEKVAFYISKESAKEGITYLGFKEEDEYVAFGLGDSKESAIQDALESMGFAPSKETKTVEMSVEDYYTKAIAWTNTLTQEDTNDMLEKVKGQQESRAKAEKAIAPALKKAGISMDDLRKALQCLN